MRRVSTLVVFLIVTASCLVLPAMAATFVWTGAAGDGRWDNFANWRGGIPGRGVDDVADLSAVDIMVDTVVHLNGNKTVAALLFGDIVPSHNWFIQPGTPPDSTLTLDVSTGEPIINVINQAATLGVIVAGNEGLTKSGQGTLVLTRPNTYTGRTSVRSGTLALDFAALGLTSNIISSSSELGLGALNIAASGGTLELVGAPGASNSQSFSGTTLDFGENAIRVNQNDAADVDLFLGRFDRDIGSVLNLTLPAAGSINAESASLTNLNGILGAWATIGSGATATWAANDGAGNIVPYTAFTDVVGAPTIAFAPSANLRWSNSTGDATLTAETTDINTLMFTDSARRAVLIPAGGALRTGVSGGIFKTDTSAGEGTSLLTIGSGGTFLTAGGAANLVGELILNANSSAPDQNGIVINSTITNNGAGPVNVIKSGNASVLFTATNTYTDGSYVTSGRLRTNATGGFGTGPVHVAQGAQAYLDAGTHTNNFFISGRGFAEPTGGPSGGALRLGGDGANVTGNVTLLGDALISAGGASTSGAAISGQITGSASVEFSSASGGVLTLTNSTNSWSGSTVIGPGVLRIGGGGEVIPNNRGKGDVILHGGPANSLPTVLDLNGKTETVNCLSSTGDPRNIKVKSNGPGVARLRLFVDEGDAADFAGVIEDGLGIVGVTKVGDGIQTLSGVNTYTGPILLQNGTLRLGSNLSLPAGAALTFTDSGWLDLAGFNAMVSQLASTGPAHGNFVFNSSTTIPSVLEVTEGNSTFAGTIANFSGFQPLALTVSGGTLILSGRNSYSGPTVLKRGTLLVNGLLDSAGNVTINNGGTLGGAGDGTNSGRVGNVTMEAGSRLQPGTTSAHNSVGKLTMSSLTVNGGDLRVSLGGNEQSDLVNVIGAANFNGPSTITPVSLGTGTFTLLTADTLRGIPPTLNAPPATRFSFALNFETLADQIRLIVTGSAKTITWTGANGSEWDLNTTANWSDGAEAEKFFNLDAVSFFDGPQNRNINLNAMVRPHDVHVSNSIGNDYTISGTGGIADSGVSFGTGLQKLGTGTFTLGGINTYTGATRVSNGLLRVTGSIASNNVVTTAGPATFAVEGTASVGGIAGTELLGTGSTTVGNGLVAATLTASFIRQSSLTIASGSAVIIKQDGGTSVVGRLSIAGEANPTATFDMNNSAAIINYTGPSPADTIRPQILAGRGGSGFGATWTGMGITSSAAAASNTSEPESRSIGYAENASLPLGAYANFGGQPVDDTSVLMAFTRTADANLDGVVNDDDVTIVGAAYAPGVPQPHWALGDFDFNGFVDDDDVTLLGVFYDPSAPPLVTPAPLSTNSVAAVPEPSMLVLAAVAALSAAIALAVRRPARKLADW